MVTVNTNTIGTAADFATFALWETDRAANIVTGDVIERAAFLDEAHTAVIAVNDAAWVTDATRYIWIDADVAARHNGTAGSGARITPAAGVNVVLFFTESLNIHMTWLEITDTAPVAFTSLININALAYNVHLDNLIVHGATANGSLAITQTNIGAGVLDIFDTDIYNVDRAGLKINGSGVTLRFYNNTMWNCATEGAASRGTFRLQNGSDNDVDMRNNLIHVNEAGSSSAIVVNGVGVPWNAGCDQNILNDGSGTTEALTGTLIENATFQAGTGGSGTRVMFANLSSGTEDLRLVEPAPRTDNAAIEFGNNLTGETVPENIFLEIDIEGDTRDAVRAWDAGADGTTLPGLLLPHDTLSISRLRL